MGFAAVFLSVTFLKNGREIAFLVDLLRRAGRLREAHETIQAALETNSDPVLGKLLNYQEGLVQACDLSCHKANEALGRENPLFWVYPKDSGELDSKPASPAGKRRWQFWK